MRKITFGLILLVFIVLVGCSEDKLEGTIIFGEKVGENELKAVNVFNLGEQMNFLVETNREIGVEEVEITLNILNPEGDYESITSSSLPVNPESDQIMNGLSADIFEQLGAGVYQLEVNIDGTVIKGDFIYQE
ncbi:hypothetical protein ACLIA0_05790 [Bacillaceae bacterium W0354]